MKQKSNGLWNKVTHAKANVWLVSIIVILFITVLVIVNYSAKLEGVSSYASYNKAKNQITASSPIATTASTGNTNPEVSVVPYITGQEITAGKQSVSPPAVGPSNTEISMSITEGSSVKIDRLCVGGASGYITNADGTILTPKASKNLTSETLLVNHDASGTAKGIHTDKVYTVHCFSLVGNKGTEKTVVLNVNVR